jgi:phosphoesterase RecJ-like protein
MRLTQEDYEACGARPEHSDKIVNYGIDLEGVMVACLADGREAGKTKFSLRAQPPCDVSKIASALGGGGHVLAAGCTLDLPMDEACATVEKLIARQLAELDQK